MKYSPIVLFTYNRIDEVINTVSTLQTKYLANESELYVYSDGGKNEGDKQKVQHVREYLHSINGFKKVHIVERDKNYGLARSVIEGVTEVVEKYGKVIVVEDDLITSRNFLCYMNQALEFYENKEEVFSISGYTMPLKSLPSYNKDTYVSLRPSSIGMATWRNRWNDIDWDVKDYEEFICDKQAIKQFNRGGIDLTRMLKHNKQKKNNSWAIRWAYAMFKERKYSIYPKLSKIQHIGFGEDASNCNGTDIYQTSLDDSSRCDFNFIDDIVTDKQIMTEFRHHYSYRNKLMKKMYEKMRNVFNTKR